MLANSHLLPPEVEIPNVLLTLLLDLIFTLLALPKPVPLATPWISMDHIRYPDISNSIISTSPIHLTIPRLHGKALSTAPVSP